MLVPAQPRQLTPQERQEALKPVRKAVREVLGFGWELFTDRPAFVASDDPRGPLQTTVRALTQYNCRVWAASDKSNQSPRVISGNTEICNPYLTSIGEGIPDGSFGIPFEGGQCPGTVYNVQFRAEVNGVVQNSAANLVGPLRYNQDLPPIPSNTGCTAQSGPWRRYSIFGQNANPAITFVGCGAQFEVTSLTALSGPDNCGNPEGIETAPPQPAPSPVIPPSVNINIPGYGPVDVTLALDDNGDPIFCVEQIGACFTVAVGDGDEEGLGGEGETPGDQGTAGDPIDVQSGMEAEGDDPSRVLIGVLVQTIAYPARTNRIFNQSESYTKGAYWVYTGGDAGLALNDTGAISRPDQFYYAGRGANRFRVVPNNGFTIRVTPFWED